MTLYLTPVIYIYLDRFQKRVSRNARLFRVKAPEATQKRSEP